MREGRITVECPECGKEYEALVLDGHVDYLKLCGDCIRAIFEKLEKEKKYASYQRQDLFG